MPRIEPNGGISYMDAAKISKIPVEEYIDCIHWLLGIVNRAEAGHKISAEFEEFEEAYPEILNEQLLIDWQK